MAKAHPTLLVREATGLVRQLSSLDVFVRRIIYFPWLTSWAGIPWLTPDYYYQSVNYYAALAGVLIPIAIFTTSYFYNKAHGIDLTKVWAQIPQVKPISRPIAWC